MYFHHHGIYILDLHAIPKDVNMKQMKLSNINLEIFEKSFLNFKKLVSSDFEFDPDNQILKTNSEDFEKWHLVSLASSYGSDLFVRESKLLIIGYQSTNISFEIDYNQQAINFSTNWKQVIEFNPAHLCSADLFLTNKLGEILDEKSKITIKEKMPDFEFNQSIFQASKKYAYFIMDNTLVFVMTEKDKAEINHIFEICWNEV